MSSVLYCNTVEAKANLNRYLSQVSSGQTVVIRRRGQAVAKLVPITGTLQDEGQEFQSYMKKLRQFHGQLRRRRRKKTRTVSLLRELRQES